MCCNIVERWRREGEKIRVMGETEEMIFLLSEMQV